MSGLTQIKEAIEKLALEERAELARWLHGWEEDDWDRQMVADIKAGRLDKMIRQVDGDIREGRLRDLP